VIGRPPRHQRKNAHFRQSREIRHKWSGKLRVDAPTRPRTAECVLLVWGETGSGAILAGCIDYRHDRLADPCRQRGPGIEKPDEMGVDPPPTHGGATAGSGGGSGRPQGGRRGCCQLRGNRDRRDGPHGRPRWNGRPSGTRRLAERSCVATFAQNPPDRGGILDSGLRGRQRMDREGNVSDDPPRAKLPSQPRHGTIPDMLCRARPDPSADLRRFGSGLYVRPGPLVLQHLDQLD